MRDVGLRSGFRNSKSRGDKFLPSEKIRYDTGSHN